MLVNFGFGQDPANMVVAGSGEYNPVMENNSTQNSAANRRTRIVILQQLDQFFKLLEPKNKISLVKSPPYTGGVFYVFC